MMGKLLSIAVPAYNAAHYLEKCLSSFLFEGMDALDVIVVDDGSTDETGTIAEQYAKDYPTVFRIIHKENGGHGSGINRAIEEAKGSYFRVVDADDWIREGSLSRYISALERADADVVLTHFHTVDMITGERRPYRNQGLPYGKRCGPEELLPLMGRAARWFSIHSITYRTEFYRALGLHLSERIFYEDTEYAVLPFKDCKSIWLEDLFVYEYLIGNVSQSVSIDSYCKRFGNLETVLERLLVQYRTLKSSEQVQAAFLNTRIQMLLGTYEKVALLYLPEKEIGRRHARRIRKAVYKIGGKLLRGTRTRYLGLLVCNLARVSPLWLEKCYAGMKKRMK